MEFSSYEGWAIKTSAVRKGIELVISDAHGNIFHYPTISWPSHRSARYYAQQFINQHIKSEN
jgi:hypothetical protein